MNKMQQRVYQMQHLFGHPQTDAPRSITDIQDTEFELQNEQKVLGIKWIWSRLHYIEEECKEMSDAIIDQNTGEMIDALTDMLVFIFGTFNFMGVDVEKIFNVVMDANMAKGIECTICIGTGRRYALPFDDDQSQIQFYKLDDTVPKGAMPFVCNECNGLGKIIKYREDGKVIKPSGWSHPDINKELGL